MFIGTWYPVSVPNFYNPVTSLLLPPDQREKWQGMRSVGHLRKDLGLKAPLNTDSLYKVSHLLHLNMQRSFSHDDSIKTSLFKRIRCFSNLVAIIPIGVKSQMLVNFPGIEFVGTATKFRGRKRNL